MAIKKISAVVAIVVGSAGGVVLLTGSAVGTAGEAAPTAALAAASPTKPSVALERVLDLPVMAEFDVDAAKARALKVGRETWTVVPSAASLCAQFPDGAITCTKRRSLGTGDLAITTIEEPAVGETKLVARPAVRRGIVADDVARVRASDDKGKLLGEVAVSNNGYAIPLGLEGQAASLEYLAADGSLIRKIDPFG